MIVAYHIDHNEGVESGILEKVGDSVAFSDLYEVDGAVRIFANRDDAQAWLDDEGGDDVENNEEL